MDLGGDGDCGLAALATASAMENGKTIDAVNANVAKLAARWRVKITKPGS